MLHSAKRPGVAAIRVLLRGDLGGSGLVYDDGRRPIRVVELFIRERDGLCRSVEARQREYGCDPGDLSLMLHHGSPRRGPESPHQPEMRTYTFSGTTYGWR